MSTNFSIPDVNICNNDCKYFVTMLATHLSKDAKLRRCNADTVSLANDENASYGDCMNSVCNNYKGFSQDYKELEVLARKGYKVPSRSTMHAWLTGNNSTVRLIRFNGLPCLLNNKGIMYPFLPGSDLIAKVVVASALNSSKITGRCRKPVAFVEDVLWRFMASDAKLEVLTMLLRTFSFVESSVAPIGNTTHNVSGDMLSPGHVGGRGVMMGRVIGDSSSVTIYESCAFGSPSPKNPDQSNPTAMANLGADHVANPGTEHAANSGTGTEHAAATTTTTPRRILASDSETETIGTFHLSIWEPARSRWAGHDKRVTVDMFVREGKKVFGILASSVDRHNDDEFDMILFDIESNTFKFEIKFHDIRRKYVEIGRFELCNDGKLEPRRCILEGKVEQLYAAFDEFKKKDLTDFEPPSPSLDFDPPSDTEQ